MSFFLIFIEFDSYENLFSDPIYTAVVDFVPILVYIECFLCR